ncbi:MAG: hypothetical protein KatS3mg103_1252 [Phycisphaerales bacterium]|nr:MAG: hypothetical protein KatS3mg103_1252 [Phycisphaerales bacterium]
MPSRDRSARLRCLLIVAAVGLARPALPALGDPPASTHAQQAYERAVQAEAQGRHREAFEAYLQAWHDPALRQQAAQRARALERLVRHETRQELGVIDTLRERLGPGFAVYRSESFLVLSDAPDDWTRSRITLLERARDQYFREMLRLGVPVHPHPQRLVCVFFGEHGDYLDFARHWDGFDAGWTAGYYSMEHNAIVIHDDRTSPSLARAMRQIEDLALRIDELCQQADAARSAGDGDRAGLLLDAAADLERHAHAERARIDDQVLRFGVAKVLHEAIHLLAFNTGLQRRGVAYPLWVSEGLAASFEAQDASARLGFAFAYEPREQELHALVLDGRLPALDQLLTLDSNDRLQAQTARPIYAAAYGLFRTLYRTHRRQLAAYLAELADMPDGRLAGEAHRAMFERHFGPIPALERRLARQWLAEARASQSEQGRQASSLASNAAGK